MKGIDEFTEQLPLITSFASAYAEVNAEQTQKVAQTFYSSLQCDLQCRDLVDKEMKEKCIKKFCSKMNEKETVWLVQSLFCQIKIFVLILLIKKKVFHCEPRILHPSLINITQEQKQEFLLILLKHYVKHIYFIRKHKPGMIWLVIIWEGFSLCWLNKNVGWNTPVTPAITAIILVSQFSFC